MNNLQYSGSFNEDSQVSIESESSLNYKNNIGSVADSFDITGEDLICMDSYENNSNHDAMALFNNIPSFPSLSENANYLVDASFENTRNVESVESHNVILFSIA